MVTQAQIDQCCLASPLVVVCRFLIAVPPLWITIRRTLPAYARSSDRYPRSARGRCHPTRRAEHGRRAVAWRGDSQRSPIWFGQTEQAAAAVQQPGKQARLTPYDQQPIVDGDVRRGALG